MIKRLLTIFATGIIILLCASGVYTYFVLSSIDIKAAFKLELSKPVDDAISFDEGGLLREDDFKFFSTFSAERNKLYLNNISKFKNDILQVNKEFKIDSLIENKCTSNRCLQFPVFFSKIPLILSKGLMGIEDYRFLDHVGLDLWAILRAIAYDIRAGKLIQGGSTLTQQIAKNLFFTNEKSFIRKIKEAIVALYIELNFEKHEILQSYFNEVYWGSLQGIRIKGVRAASLVYFGKDLEEIEPYEMAIIVSMLKGPNYYHPIRKTERLRKRANFILHRLKVLKLVSKSSMAWGDTEWSNWTDRLKSIQTDFKMESLFIAMKNPQEKMAYESYIISLSAKRLLKSKETESKNLSVKVVLTQGDNSTRYYSRFERNVEKAIEEEKHQIGSTVKPLFYYLATKRDFKLTDEVSLGEVTLKLKSGDWTPRESHKIEETKISYERALQESFNIPVIKLAKNIGFDLFEKDMLTLFEDIKTPLSEYPAQLLGAIEVSVYKLNEVYKKVLDDDCKNESGVINALRDPTKTTIKHRVNKLLKQQEFFGKTGTTNNGFDNWFVGYDGNRVITIWTGFEGIRDPQKKLNLYGASTSFMIFQEIILFSGRRLGNILCK